MRTFPVCRAMCVIGLRHIGAKSVVREGLIVFHDASTGQRESLETMPSDAHEQSHRWSAIALSALLIVIVGLGALWLTWLGQEVTGPNTQSGHHDFFAFYSAASLIRDHQPQLLYDSHALTALERQIFPHPTGYAGYMPFLNPPAAAALLSPLALLPEPSARLVWLVVNIAAAIACALLLTSGRCVRIRILTTVALLASFPAFQALIEGQWSFCLLLGGLGALAAARRNNPWLAGALVSVFWLKPPLLLFVLVWLMVTRHWRIAASAVLAVMAITIAALPWTGVASNINYVGYLGGVSLAHVSGAGAAGTTTWEGALPNMEGLIGLPATVVGQQNAIAVDLIAAALAAGLIAFFVVATRSQWLERPRHARYAVAAVSLGLLLDPHLYAQDCVLIAVIIALLLPAARSLRAQAAVVIGVVAVMDLSALDTLSVEYGFLRPPHLLTLALIASVIALARPAKNGLAAEPLRPAASPINSSPIN
jgi:Glycosyltransferase family 87